MMFSPPRTALICLLLMHGWLQAEPLEIMVEDDAAPWSRADGDGHANAVVRAAYAASKTDIKLSVVPYARCKQMVINGLAPACFSMAWEPALQGKVVFAKAPLYEAYARFYFSAKHLPGVNQESQFKPGMRIGVVNGYEYPNSLQALKARGVIFETSISETLNLKKLERGRIDAALLMLDETKTDELLLAQAGVKDVVFGFESGSQGSYLGFSTRHPLGEFARKKFDEGFQIIARDGALEALKRQRRSGKDIVKP